MEQLWKIKQPNNKILNCYLFKQWTCLSINFHRASLFHLIGYNFMKINTKQLNEKMYRYEA